MTKPLRDRRRGTRSNAPLLRRTLLAAATTAQVVALPLPGAAQEDVVEPDVGSAPTAAPRPPLIAREGDQLFLLGKDGERTPVSLGCPVRDVVRDGDDVYVACDVAGVVTLALTPDGRLREVDRRLVDGRATGVSVRNGVLQVDVEPFELPPPPPSYDADRLTAPEAPAPPAPVPAPPPAPLPEPQGVSHQRRPDPRPPWVVFIGTDFIIPGDEGGLGLLHWLRVTRRLEAPIALTAELAPAGWATGGFGPNPWTGAAHLLVALDLRRFSLGGGVGWSTENLGGDSGSTLSLAQSLRLGQVWGSRLLVRSTVQVGGGAGANLGSLDVEMVFPFADDDWELLLRSGGGNVGWASATVGARTWVPVSPRWGEVAAGVTIGGATLFQDLRGAGTVFKAGLSVGVELVWVPATDGGRSAGKAADR